MKIYYQYDPPACRFWLGATDGTHSHFVQLQHWMSPEDVIEMIKHCQAEVESRS